MRFSDRKLFNSPHLMLTVISPVLLIGQVFIDVDCGEYLLYLGDILHFSAKSFLEGGLCDNKYKRNFNKKIFRSTSAGKGVFTLAFK